MKGTRPLIIIVILAGLWLVLGLFQEPPASPGEDMVGIDFVVPDTYHTLDLGEAGLAEAAAALLGALDTEAAVAVLFRDAGGRRQILVESAGDGIDERIIRKSGTVQRTLWPGSPRQRLEWAADHGDLAAPELPAPERRNPYH